VDSSTNPVCPVAKKDPTDIRFSPGLDRLRSKAVLETSPIDMSTVNVGILLSNRTQVLYRFEMAGRLLKPVTPDGKYFRFRDFEARTVGGLYEMKIKLQRGGNAYTLSAISYADLSAATDPMMRVQFYIGGARPYITKEGRWKQLARGWRAPKDH
jgi:hypothetical protein